MRRALILPALVSCSHQDEPTKQQPRTALFDASPRRASTLAEVARAVTQDVNAAVTIELHADGSLAIAGAAVPLAELAARVDALASPAEADARAVSLFRDPCFLEQLVLGSAEAAPAQAGLRGVPTETPVCDGQAPLILVDAGASAARLVEVMSTLPASQLGVTDGAQTRTLGYAFFFIAGNRPPDTAPEAVITIGPDGVDVARHAGDVRIRLHLDGVVTAGALVTELAALRTDDARDVAIGEPSRFGIP